jgi:hypothetical protein
VANGEQRKGRVRWFSSKEQNSTLIFIVRMMGSRYVIHYIIIIIIMFYRVR